MKRLFHASQFRKYSWLTVFAVFILILLGGTVRSTGSGMGCPDWPKCFGQYIPPTHESQLPEDYSERFTENRIKKAERFASLLYNLGLHKQANSVVNDPNLTEPEVFNATKTWIEYVNRLWGALTGIFALLALITGLQYVKSHRPIALWSGLSVFLIFFNAWMGSIVVSTNLLGWVVTLHYLLAYVAVFLMMLAAYKAQPLFRITFHRPMIHWLWVMLALTVLQIVSGTGLRENTDKLIQQGLLFIQNELNISGLGTSFQVHRFAGIMLMLVNLRLILRVRKEGASTSLLRFLWISVILILLQIITGSLNLNFAFPVLAQIQHIFGAGILFGVQAYLLIHHAHTSFNPKH